MPDEANNNAVTIEDDLNTTAPQPKPDVWTMPDPVFRKTSGKLPQGFEKNYVPASTEPSSPPNASSQTPVADDSKPKSETLKLLLVILGLVGMVAFLIVFVSVVYFFFLRSSGGE